MLINLLSMDNYVHYNIKVAEILGLHQAIYLSELLNINDKAVRKSKLNNNFFVVDREYITKRTTLSKEEQLKIDKQFLDIGLLEKVADNINEVTLNISVLTTLLCGDEKVITDLKKFVKSSSKTKTLSKEEQLKLLKSLITTTNVELFEAFSEWIDAIYSKLGWMSKKAVTVGEQIVNDAANHDLDMALRIVEIATINGYKDMTWAVKMYNDNYRPKYHVDKSIQERATQLSNEVF